MTCSVAVLVTLFNDVRVLRTLESLDAQTRPPQRVLVADGGSTDGSDGLAATHAAPFPLEVETLPGSVAETRAQAVPTLEEDIVVFLDADQVAPRDWLERLVRPIEQGAADIVGGATRPWAPPENKAQRYIQDFEAWFYDEVVARDATMVPMGNSAWRRTVFDAVGNFDPRLRWGGEDYDMNLRACSAGFTMHYAPDAWVYHDQAHLDNLGAIMRRKYRYQKGAAMAYLKNGRLWSKAPGAVATARFGHPYELLGNALKPFALASGWWTWRRVRDRGGHGRT